jgi:hypothetical protein
MDHAEQEGLNHEQQLLALPLMCRQEAQEDEGI